MGPLFLYGLFSNEGYSVKKLLESAKVPADVQNADGMIEQLVLPTHAATAMPYARVSLQAVAAEKFPHVPAGVPHEAKLIALISPVPGLHAIVKAREAVHFP